jgi:alkylation response protein AidB-like acyl-CoA dehydrogenase
MDFDFNEDQRALADTVQRFIAKDYNFEKRHAILESASGWDKDVWQELADLGVLALNIDEEHGGMGFGPLETGLVMGAFGAGLLLEPYLAAAVIAPALIRRLTNPVLVDTAAHNFPDLTARDFRDEWLPKIAAGDAIVVLAHFEPGARYDTAKVKCTAKAGGDSYRLNGHKAVVVHGASADLWLVSAGLENGDMALFAVTPDARGVKTRDYPTLDGLHAADIEFSNTPATIVSSGGTASDMQSAIEAALDIGLAAMCFEAVGIMEATLAETGEYLKTRQQFGQPIGRFQALQHRMADMLLHLEQARSMSYLAAMNCENPNTTTRQRTLSAAKVTIGQACRFIAQNAVQLHGGMGMTDELMLSHWFKRLTTIEMSMGDTDLHLQRFAALSSPPAQAA